MIGIWDLSPSGTSYLHIDYVRRTPSGVTYFGFKRKIKISLRWSFYRNLKLNLKLSLEFEIYPDSYRDWNL